MLKKLSYGHILTFLLFIIFTGAQQKEYHTISGFVYDQKSGESLIGANILIKSLATGSSTNVSGYFVIPDIPAGKYEIVFSYLGYKPKSYQADISKKDIDKIKIYLEPDAIVTDEVVVTDDSIRVAEKLFNKPISKINLNQKQVNQIPRVIEADLLRALQTMPGIVSLSDFSSALYIRGGTPDQNLYLIDGTDVYNPEHAFGLFSTFNTNAIKKVEISKGGFAANYGGRLSSVLDVTNLDGNRNNFEAVTNISLLSASTTIQTPIGSIGSLSGSIRRTYLDQTYAKWSDDIPNYYFYDGNLKAFFDLGEKDKLTFNIFSGKDDLEYRIDKDKPESFGFDYVWGNTTGGFNWKHIFSPKLFSSFWVTGSRFRSDFDMPKIMNINEYNYLSDYAVKGNLEYYATNELNIKFGLEHKILHFIYRQTWDEGKVDIDKYRQYTTAYASANWKPEPVWDFEAGLRYNLFNAESSTHNIEPRLSVKYRLSETSTVKLAAGYYTQFLNRIPRLFFASIWTASDENTKESTSSHLILGYQKEVADLFELEVEGYYKNYKDIHVFNQIFGALVRPDRFDEKGLPVYTSTKNLFNTGDGDSYGIEIMLRKDIGAVTGWIAYSYSDTKYKFPDINQGNSFKPRHNRAHVVNFVLNSDVGNLLRGKINAAPDKSSSRWILGLNFIYSSGQPLTLPGSAYFVNTMPDWNNSNASGESLPSYHLYPGNINSYNLPDYARLDLSITWEKDFGNWSIAPYLQIFNLGNRKNLWFIQYQEEKTGNTIKQKIEKINMLPLLPSLGISIKF